MKGLKIKRQRDERMKDERIKLLKDKTMNVKKIER